MKWFATFLNLSCAWGSDCIQLIDDYGIQPVCQIHCCAVSHPNTDLTEKLLAWRVLLKDSAEPISVPGRTAWHKNLEGEQYLPHLVPQMLRGCPAVLTLGEQRISDAVAATAYHYKSLQKEFAGGGWQKPMRECQVGMWILSHTPRRTALSRSSHNIVLQAAVLYSVTDWALAQLAQSGWVVLLLGDLHKLSMVLGSRCPCLSRELSRAQRAGLWMWASSSTTARTRT